MSIDFNAVVIGLLMGVMAALMYYIYRPIIKPRHPLVKLAHHVWQTEQTHGEPRPFAKWFLDALGFHTVAMSRRDNFYRLAYITNTGEAIIWFESWLKTMTKTKRVTSFQIYHVDGDGEGQYTEYSICYFNCHVTARHGHFEDMYSKHVTWTAWERQHDIEQKLFGKKALKQLSKAESLRKQNVAVLPTQMTQEALNVPE